MYNGVEYYYVKNLQGDIIGLIDASGAWVVEYRYDAWGRLLAVTGTLASTLGQENPLRYRGYYYDAETGFYYVSSRYYSPEICRFISPDKTSLLEAEPMKLTSKNLYAYCDNNPMSKTDLSGEFAIAAIGVIVGKALVAAAPYVLGAVANIAMSATVAKISGDKFTFRDAVVAGAIGAAGAGGPKAVVFSKVADVAYAAYSGWEDYSDARVGLFAGMMSVIFNAFDVAEALKLAGLGANIDDFISKSMIGFEYGIVSNTTSGYFTEEYDETQKKSKYNRYDHVYTVKERQMARLF